MDDIISEIRHEKCIEHVEEFFMATCMELVASERLDDAEALHAEHLHHLISHLILIPCTLS